MSLGKKLQIALVGLGTWARIGHLPLYKSPRFASRVDLVAICSRSKNKALAWAEDFNVPRGYDNFRDMLERERMDAIVICTPDHAHYQYIIDGLDSGLHVLTEKPLTMNVDQCKKIASFSVKKQKDVITLYHKRADPLWAEAGLRIRNGDYGAFRMGWMSIQNPCSVPNGNYFTSDLSAHSDPNWFLGTHFYDLFRYMTGLNPVKVTAYHYPLTEDNRKQENTDSIKADFVLDNGGTLTVFLSWNLSENYPSLTKQDMRLHFENGELDLDGTRRGFTQDSKGAYNYINPYFMRSTLNGNAGYAADFLESALISIADTDEQPPVQLPNMMDACWATHIAQCVEQSAAKRNTVDIKPIELFNFIE